MKLSDFVITDAAIPELQATDRNGVIREMVNSIASAIGMTEEEAVAVSKAVIQRENQGSTGIGKGIAVPHIKHAAVKSIVGAIGGSKSGIDFSSLDKAPVYSVLLLISPSNKPDQHLEAMESLFSHLQRDMFRKFLRQSETVEAIMDLLQEADEAGQQSGL